MNHSLPPVTIRSCKYRELERIMPIYNHHVVHTMASLDLEPKRLSQMQEVFNTLSDHDLPFLLATASNVERNKEEVLGFAYANFYRFLPAFSGTVEVVIYLDPKATEQGVGQYLLDDLMAKLKAVVPDTARAHGIREVLAIVPVDEGRDASTLFLNAGFEDRGLLKGVAWKMGRWVDTRIFQRSLGEEPKSTGKTAQKRKATERHWWSSLFRRRKR